MRLNVKKPGVLEALKARGSYCVCMGRDYIDKDIEDRREAILKTLATEGLRIEPEKVVILNSSGIADWASSHPAVIRLQICMVQILAGAFELGIKASPVHISMLNFFILDSDLKFIIL